MSLGPAATTAAWIKKFKKDVEKLKGELRNEVKILISNEDERETSRDLKLKRLQPKRRGPSIIYNFYGTPQNTMRHGRRNPANNFPSLPSNHL
ncbi:unnamed protein product [Prunus armeniaca]|uniref:Uncharacterized protein n=1 Tax=Prunus armeniaca TaxID=36596 RepID=A0A6J5XBV3_PRUAR|nr:unnamed protein product [Prunus armeniaca]